MCSARTLEENENVFRTVCNWDRDELQFMPMLVSFKSVSWDTRGIIDLEGRLYCLNKAYDPNIIVFICSDLLEDKIHEAVQKLVNVTFNISMCQGKGGTTVLYYNLKKIVLSSDARMRESSLGFTISCNVYEQFLRESIDVVNNDPTVGACLKSINM